MRNRDTHQALKNEVISSYVTDTVEVLLVRSQWDKADIEYSAHVNPKSFSTWGIQRTDFLNYIGYLPSNCYFIVGGKCYTRSVDEKFDPKKFAEAFDSAYAQLEGAQQGLKNCGFSLR